MRYRAFLNSKGKYLATSAEVLAKRHSLQVEKTAEFQALGAWKTREQLADEMDADENFVKTVDLPFIQMWEPKDQVEWKRPKATLFDRIKDLFR